VRQHAVEDRAEVVGARDIELGQRRVAAGGGHGQAGHTVLLSIVGRLGVAEPEKCVVMGSCPQS
jgi:hypothetical protein